MTTNPTVPRRLATSGETSTVESFCTSSSPTRRDSKFAIANKARCRLCGANDTQLTGIDRMRHAFASTTLDIYSHLMPDADESTRTAVGNVIRARMEAPADALRTEGPA
jgi:hypothetical protein